MFLRKAIISICLIIVSGICFALDYNPSLSVCLWPDLCFPTESYLLEYPGDPSVRAPVERTSFGIGALLCPLGFSFGGLSVGLGVSYRSVTRSLAFGISTLKPYGGLGICLSACLDLSALEVGFSFGAFDMRFRSSDDSFPAFEGEVHVGKAMDIGSGFASVVFGGLSVFAKGDSLSLCPKLGGSVSWKGR